MTRQRSWIVILATSLCLLLLGGSVSAEESRHNNGLRAARSQDTIKFYVQREEEEEFQNHPVRERNLYQETTHKSFVDRFGESLMSVLFGLLLCVVAPCLLFWNEGRAVRRMKQIKYISENAKEGVSSFNEGSLVHVVGVAEPTPNNQAVQDPVFGIPPVSSEITDMLVLKRTVEMLQWVEHSSSETKKTAGGGEETVTTYTYSKEWRNTPINSGSFKESHRSNPSMKYQGETWYCPGGAQLQVNENGDNKQVLQLTNKLLHQIPADQEYDSNVHGKTLETNLIGGDDYYGSLSSSYDNHPVWTDSTTLELGPHNPPDIGTHRVEWQYSRSRTVSILAQLSALSNQQLVEWHHPEEPDFTVCRLMTGDKSLPEMIQILQSENTALTWGLRVLGCILWICALQMMAKPLEVILDLATIPFLGLEPGTLASWLTGFASVLLGVGLSLVVMAVAWLVYRPLYGILLLAAALGLFLLLPKGGADAAMSAPAATSSIIGCPGGSMVACTKVCQYLVDAAYKACIESCLSKCA